MELRPYQRDAVAAIHEAWRQYRKTLLVLPTGTGKTVVFSSVIGDCVKNDARVLILAHREELLTQASDKLKLVTGIDTVLEKASSSALFSDVPVTVGSVQTLCGAPRLNRFPSDYYSHIIVDEAHHVLADSYMRILEHFPDAKVLGCTATPDRADRRNLGQYFDSLAYEYTLVQAIQDGYLCPIKAQMIPLRLSLRSVKISAGDYNAGDIGHALEPFLGQIAAEMAKTCHGRKTVVFLPLISTSQKFCGLLNQIGLRAAEVNGESDNRAEILADFEHGKYDVLCNSMLLTEGWDCPAVDCIVVLRPTKIRSLYQQMVGRGLRPSPGKDHLLLLDFLWMTEKHDLCKPSALISKDETIAKRIDKIIEQYGDAYLLDAEDQAERDAIAEREATLAKELEAMRHRQRKLVDPIQYALSIAAEDLANYEPTFAWEMAPPTKKQLELLEKRGILPDAVENAGKASLIIDKLFRRQDAGLSTPKQIRLLERYGFTHVGTWPFDAANHMISWMAQHGWTTPRNINVSTYQP